MLRPTGEKLAVFTTSSVSTRRAAMIGPVLRLAAQDHTALRLGCRKQAAGARRLSVIR
jgi:hypothetical protein